MNPLLSAPREVTKEVIGRVNSSRQILISSHLQRLRNFSALPQFARNFIIDNLVRLECSYAKATDGCNHENHHHQPFLSSDSTIDAQIIVPLLVFVMAHWEHSAHSEDALRGLTDAVITPEIFYHLQMTVYRTIPQPGSLWGISASYAYTMPKQQNNFDVKRRALTCKVSRAE